MKQNIYPISGNDSPILTKNGYRTLSHSAINSFFTSIPNRKIGNYVIKLVRDGESSTLMHDCPPDIYAEISKNLNEISQTIQDEERNITILEIQNGAYMYSAYNGNIIIGYCNSKYFDARAILAYCMFTITALNASRDRTLKHFYNAINNGLLCFLDLLKAQSALLADAFVSGLLSA